ncbi:MAG: hypothetical protein IJS81_07300 [Selenomonadaceae bacterium]|nr:hypothetical protein [Selenomonadaceae bacterium]
MEKFVELIQRVHKERFSVVRNKILAEKIPVAFLSLAPIETALDKVNRFIKDGINITDLITGGSPPPLTSSSTLKLRR